MVFRSNGALRRGIGNQKSEIRTQTRDLLISGF
jgi:hypothetical protein